MIGWIIALIVWLVGIPIAYKFTKKWESQTKTEQIYFAIIWPLLIPLYIVYWIQHKL